MKGKAKFVALISVVTIGFLIWFVVVPAFRFSAARHRYPIGMDYQEALKRIPPPFQVQTSGVVFPDGFPTEQQKQIYSLYDIIAPKEGVYLEFNHYEKLITVIPLHSPWDTLRQKISRD